jgi:hypothetical protein
MNHSARNRKALQDLSHYKVFCLSNHSPSSRSSIYRLDVPTTALCLNFHSLNRLDNQQPTQHAHTGKRADRRARIQDPSVKEPQDVEHWSHTDAKLLWSKARAQVLLLLLLYYCVTTALLLIFEQHGKHRERVPAALS